MGAKSLSEAKTIDPSGVSLVILLACILIFGAIATGGSVGDLTKNTRLTLLPLSVCTLIVGLLGVFVVPLLTRLKTGQIIREDGPQAHLKKAGTPTMGGIFFVPTAIAVALIWSQFVVGEVSGKLVAVSLVTFAYGFIGWYDDWQVLQKKSNKGISPRMKLILQIAIGVLFSLWGFLFQSESILNLVLPGNLSFALGWFFLPLAVFVFAAESNATNLTDGVDGLAAGTGAIALLGLGLIIAVDAPDLTIFCACLSGSCLGFLIHNRNPATVFMGDTGSLALGGALAAVGLLSGNLWSLFVVSGIFFVESLSVIAQVAYYKATKDADGNGKRLFKMAPIHHHFELSGWTETQVVGIFYLVNVLLVAIAYFVR